MAITGADLSKLQKIVYKDKDINLLPSSAIIQKLFPLSGDKPGRSINMPVMVKASQGATYTNNGVASYEDDIAAVFQEASVVPYEIVMHDYLSLNDASAMAESASAYRKGSAQIFKQLLESHAFRAEMALYYGSSVKGIMAVSSVSGQVITITDASWSPSVARRLVGAKIEVFDESAAQQDSTLTVASVQLSAKTITVTGTCSSVTSTGRIFFKGARVKDGVGIDKIAINTGSMQGIDAATYPDWAGQAYAVGSVQLSRQKVLAAASLGYGAGYEGDYYLFCSIEAAQYLADNEAALTRHKGSDAEKVNGASEIRWLGVGGDIIVTPHPYCKNGEAHLVPKDSFEIIGNAKPGFSIPGSDPAELFILSETKTAFKLQTYSKMTGFSTNPNHFVKLTGIVN
jgi:YHS domain-containing protein